MSNLHTVSEFPSNKAGPPISTDNDGILARVLSFLDQSGLIELPEDGDFGQYVDLETPQPDEFLIGNLNGFERNCFEISFTLENVMRDIMVEIEAGYAEQVIELQRRERLPYQAAAQKFFSENRQSIADSDRISLNMLSNTSQMLMSLWTWSFRTRNDNHDHGIVVRTGYSVYGHDTHG